MFNIQAVFELFRNDQTYIFHIFVQKNFFLIHN